MAGRVINGYARWEGKRGEDITPADVPGIVYYMKRTLAELVRIPGEPPLIEGWRKEVDRISQDLHRFAHLMPNVLPRSRKRTASSADDDNLVVKASDYWKGREPGEADRAGSVQAPRLPLGDQLRQAFLESLGPAGFLLYDLAVERIQKTSETLSPRDVRAIADIAKGTATELVAVIDSSTGRSDLEFRTRTLRERLIELSGESQ